jgi:hypothetical protein
LLYEFKLFLYKFGSFGLCRFKYTMWDQMLTKGMFMHREEEGSIIHVTMSTAPRRLQFVGFRLVHKTND